MLYSPRIFSFDIKYLHISSSVNECMYLFLFLNYFKETKVLILSNVV